MKINANKSPDKRLRTEIYKTQEGDNFSVAEMTAVGTLITEFKINGELVNQVLVNTKNHTGALSDYLKEKGELVVMETQVYEHIRVNAVCTNCGSGKIERELDQRDTTLIRTVPVVPLFICKNCGTKFYSMSDNYLRSLVGKNNDLFAADELAEMEKDKDKFVDTLNKYIISIFASKKIHRLEIKG